MLVELLNKYKNKAEIQSQQTNKNNLDLSTNKQKELLNSNFHFLHQEDNNNLNNNKPIYKSNQKIQSSNLNSLFNPELESSNNKNTLFSNAKDSKSVNFNINSSVINSKSKTNKGQEQIEGIYVDDEVEGGNPNDIQTNSKNKLFQRTSKNIKKPDVKDSNIKLDEDKFEEEFNTIIKKNEEIMRKYCTLYDNDEAITQGNQHNLGTQNGKPKTNCFSNVNTDFNPRLNIKPLNADFLAKKKNKVDHTKTTGKDWFNMKAEEMTPEVENDLRAMQLRHILNPRRFYKKPDINGLPKFFQIGTLETSITEGKQYQLKKHERKNRLVEEFLEEDVNANYSRRKFTEIQEKKSRLGRKKQRINEYKKKNKSKGKKNSEYIIK